jgi:hypothetical protein
MSAIRHMLQGGLNRRQQGSFLNGLRLVAAQPAFSGRVCQLASGKGMQNVYSEGATLDTIPIQLVAVPLPEAEPPDPRGGYIDHGIAKVLISAAVRT